jgi:hypothetical protein
MAAPPDHVSRNGRTNSLDVSGAVIESVRGRRRPAKAVERSLSAFSRPASAGGAGLYELVSLDMVGRYVGRRR